jgi:hypothetical protein
MLDPHHFNMDPDPHQSDTEYESDTLGLQSTDPPRLHFEPPRIIEAVHGPPWLN